MSVVHNFFAIFDKYIRPKQKYQDFIKKFYYNYFKRTTMKKYTILTILLSVLSIVSFGQSEFEEKQQKTFDRYQRPSNPPSEVIIVPSTNYNPYFNPYYPNLYYNRYTPYNPYYGIPIVTPRMFGKTVVSMGILSTIGTDPSLPTFGMYGTIGSENVFFKLSYEGSRVSEYEHYNNITLNDVYGWGDESRGKFQRYSSLFLGIGGKATPTIYPFLGSNFYQMEEDLVFFDEFKILSDDGEYSINGLDKNGLNVRGGIMFRKNNFEMETSLTLMNPARLGFGIGFNF